MENVIYIILLVLAIIVFKFIFKVNLKKAKSLQENKELEKITDKFPDNIEVAKEMLDMLGNKGVKIEEAKDTGTSLYIAITNKISIADMKNNYARLQTIAHECLHSIQSKRTQLFNFIYSNVYFIYFLCICILSLLRLNQHGMLHLFILTILGFIYYAIRSYLEMDAMTKAKPLAKEYLEEEGTLSEEEQKEILDNYEIINEIGIKMTNYKLIMNCTIKIIIYAVILAILH